MLYQYFFALLCILVEFASNLPIYIPTTEQLFNTDRQAKHPLCVFEGFLFLESDIIDEGYLKSRKTCWQTRCGKNGQLIKSIVPCESIETKKLKNNYVRTTTSEPLKINGCMFRGVRYKPGEDIQVLSDWRYNRCYGTRCNKIGEIVAWENFNCYSTPSYSFTTDNVPTTLATLLDFTSSFPSTEDPKLEGCYDNNVMYHPGEEISYRYFNENETCWGKYCNFNYKIISWQGTNCNKGSRIPTTDIPITSTESSSTEEGCYVDGQHYNANSRIDKADDGVSWCFGRYCNEQSRVVYWDDFDCDVTKQDGVSTTMQTSTLITEPSTSEIPSTTYVVPSNNEKKDGIEKMDLKIQNKIYSTIQKKVNTKSAIVKFFENFPFYRKKS